MALGANVDCGHGVVQAELDRRPFGWGVNLPGSTIMIESKHQSVNLHGEEGFVHGFLVVFLWLIVIN